jgi:hypothetical protein
MPARFMWKDIHFKVPEYLNRLDLICNLAYKEGGIDEKSKIIF